MKKTNFKNSILKCFAVACLATTAIGVLSLQNMSASATTETPYSTLAMEDGASVRYATTKEEMGIRFRLTMSKAQYEAIHTTYSNVSFGILIAPNDYLSEGHELNAANVFGIGGTQIYGWAEPDGNGGWNEYTGSKVEIVNFSTTELTVSSDDANVYEFYGALVDIMGTDANDSANNIDREFCGKGYMLYTENDTQKVHIVGDEDNVRSMAYVAQKVSTCTSDNKPTDAQKAMLKQLYIDGVTSASKVNYYGLKKDGSYELLKTETTSTKTQIGETVTLSDMETALESEGYNYVAKKSDNSALVWANEKTELNVYYYQADLGLIDSQEVTTFDYKTAFPEYTYILQRYTERHRMFSATNSSTEATQTLDMAEYLTDDGLLDLSKLDGTYHLIASKGDDINTVSFDAYDSTKDWVWATVSEDNATMFARGFQSNTYGCTTSSVAALERSGATNDYFKIAWNPANGKTGIGTMVGNNGFSVLSIHSKAYYEKMLEEQPNVQLEFRFTMAAAFLDTVDTTKNVLAPNTLEGATQRGMIKTAYKNTASDYNGSAPSSTISGSTPITTGSWWRVRVPLSTLLANWEHLRGAQEGTGQAINGRRWQGQLVTWTWGATSNMDSNGAYMSKFEIYVGEFAWYTAA